MDKYKMYKQKIESDKQALTAFIKKHGYIENLGQPEAKEFKSRVMNCLDITYPEKCYLIEDYHKMIDNL
jgi:hypothetical protein